MKYIVLQKENFEGTIRKEFLNKNGWFNKKYQARLFGSKEDAEWYIEEGEKCDPKYEKAYFGEMEYEYLEFRNLKAYREASYMSQSELAEKSGVSIRMIQSYEQGFKDINKAQACTVKKLSEALGCRMEDILE